MQHKDAPQNNNRPREGNSDIVEEAIIPGSDLVIRKRSGHIRVVNKREGAVVQEVEKYPGVDWKLGDVLISKDNKHLFMIYPGNRWYCNFDFMTVNNNKIALFRAGHIVQSECLARDYDKALNKMLIFQGSPQLLGTAKGDCAVFRQGYKISRPENPAIVRTDVYRYLVVSLKTKQTAFLDNFDEGSITKPEELKWKVYGRQQWNYLWPE